LTVRGAIKKAEIEYQRTVVRLLGDMRETNQIPFEWIADAENRYTIVAENRYTRRPKCSGKPLHGKPQPCSGKPVHI
jgi:hypothetical protein